MPLTYESAEFSEELKKRLNASPTFREKAKGMSWRIFMMVKDLPFAVSSTYADGELVERKHIPSVGIDEERKNADFIVEIPTYELSVEMATGKKSLEALFMSGAIKVDGSIFKALKYREAMELTAETTTELATVSIIPPKEEFLKKLQQRGLL